MAIDIIKKLKIAVALGLVIPYGALAITPDDEVTIRLIEMHEKSTSSVMNRIELSDASIDKAAEEANVRKRLIEHKRDVKGIDEMDRDLTHYLEQTQNQDQGREEMEQAQDQIRDSVPRFENKSETGNGAGTK